MNTHIITASALLCALGLAQACDQARSGDIDTVRDTVPTQAPDPEPSTMNVNEDPSPTVADQDLKKSAEDLQETAEGMLGMGDDSQEPGASASFETVDDVKLEGTGKLYATADGVRVVVDVEDAAPGKHGFHIHEKGDCSDIAGKSMGGHFSPEKHDHALPNEKDPGARHLGDLGNLEVAADGKGHLEMVLAQANLKDGDPMNLRGKAFVIHSGEDSGHAKQPAGDSGKPVACGVIN